MYLDVYEIPPFVHPNSNNLGITDLSNGNSPITQNGKEMNEDCDIRLHVRHTTIPLTPLNHHHSLVRFFPSRSSLQTVCSS